MSGPEVGLQVVGGRRYASLDDLIEWFEWVLPSIDAVSRLGLSAVPKLLAVYNTDPLEWRSASTVVAPGGDDGADDDAERDAGDESFPHATGS